MAAFLDERFVCTYAKKGTLTVYQHADTGNVVKEGGNILSHVTSAEGALLHSIPANPGPEGYLAQLEFAAGLAELDRDQVQAQHHELAILNRIPLGSDARVHRILDAHPLAPLPELEERLFVEILGQTYAPDAPLTLEVLNDAEWNATMNMAMG
ncbi:hypothetical protein OAX78_01990 [Planctomycetota bacterium]|nr:hypothetical protein [Planctomycetota bacterium]